MKSQRYENFFTGDLRRELFEWIESSDPTQKLLCEWVELNFTPDVIKKISRTDNNRKLNHSFVKFLKNNNIILRGATKEERINSQKEANLRDYGVEHKWHSEEIMDKVKQTNMEKYGTTNPGAFNGPLGPPAGANKLTLDDFINRSREVHGDRYNYSKSIYTKARNKITIICKEHGEFSQTADSHMRGVGCPHCSGRAKKTKNEFIKKARSIHGKRYSYDKVKYINNRTHVIITCKEHGDFRQIPANHTNSGHGCPICGMNKSRGEDRIALFLDNNNVKYVRQKRFNGCKNKRRLPFDFHLPKYNILIEYDGEHHYDTWRLEDKDKAYEKLMIVKKNDKIKNKYCRDNNIKLIRIPYWDFDNIEDILVKELDLKTKKEGN